MAELEADVKEELYMELPDRYGRSKDRVGRLQKAMHGLVHVALLRSTNIGAKLKARNLERFQVDPCVPRRRRQGNVVHVDDLPLLSATKEDEK